MGRPKDYQPRPEGRGLERGFYEPELRGKFDPQDPSWTRYRQVEAWRTTDAFERLSRPEARARRAFYRVLAELRRHKEPCHDEPCRDRKGAVALDRRSFLNANAPFRSRLRRL